MSTTLFGTISDRLGHAWWERYDMVGERAALHTTATSAQPSGNFLRSQPSKIPIDISHDPGRTIGETVYLERDAGLNLWAVGVVSNDWDLPDDEAALYWSSLTTGRSNPGSPIHTNLELRAVAVTAEPAGVCLVPLRSRPGDIRRCQDWLDWEDTPPLLNRAIEYVKEHRRGDALTIADVDSEYWTSDDEPLPRSPATYAYRRDERPVGPLRHSGARGKVLTVH